jgi:hypothetical protein
MGRAKFWGFRPAILDKQMNQSIRTEDLAKRLTRYVDIVGSLDFDDAVAASYLLSERSREPEAAVVIHLDEWINLIEQGNRARAYAEALSVIAKFERGIARQK